MRTDLIWLVAAASLCAAPTAWADDKILIQLPAVLDPGANVDEDVKQECDIQALVGNQIFKKLKERYPATVALSTVPGSERFIRIRIVNATKIQAIEVRRINVVAEIVQDNKVIVSNTARDQTMAMPGQGLSLCDVMERVAAAIGRKVASWAPLPYMRASPAATTKGSDANQSPRDASQGSKPAAQPPTELR